MEMKTPLEVEESSILSSLEAREIPAVYTVKGLGLGLGF